METMSPQEEGFLESHGWYSHLVFSEDNAQKWVNYHTHELPELYGHLDFQFVLPVDRNTLHALATKLVDRVKKGERFAAGMRLSGIARKYDVLLVKTTESQSNARSVLRVILPDEDGNLDRETIGGIFATQYQELSD
jgi:Domain of unknown function (DUF4262)